MVRAICPKCRKSLRAGDDWAGKVGKCPHCKADVAFPSQPIATGQPVAARQNVQQLPQITPVSTKAAQQRVASQAEVSGRELLGFEHDITKPRFPALRLIARGYEFMAMLTVVFAVLAIIGVVVGTLYGGERLWAGAIIVIPVAVLVIVLVTAAITVILLSTAQLIRLALQIEQNTRDTHQELVEQSKRSGPSA